MPIHNALANWKEIWLLRDSSDGPGTTIFADLEQGNNSSTREMWKRSGFMRNAPEFWLLAKIVLERLESTLDNEEAADDLLGVSDGNRGSSTLSSSVLDKYDETSMSQVNALITGFQKLNL